LKKSIAFIFKEVYLIKKF